MTLDEMCAKWDAVERLEKENAELRQQIRDIRMDTAYLKVTLRDLTTELRLLKAKFYERN
jgi:uncharacterized protein (UPF0335 family)